MQKKIIILIIAMLFIFTAAGCGKTDTPIENTTANPQDTSAPAQEKAPDANLDDENMTGKTIINTYGNYIIPIPDDMWDKIEFTRNGAMTTITHKTTDGSQAEQNPVLVTIGSVKDGESFDGESFMECAGNIFYRSIRFDMPYTEGSEDASEFAVLYEALPEVLNTLDLIDKTTVDEEAGDICEPDYDAPKVSESGMPFSIDDVYIADFHIGDGKEETLEKAGTPEDYEKFTVEATGDEREIYKFSFGQLVFMDEKLVVVQVSSGDLIGPRGINLTMTLDEVTSLFSYDIELNNDYTTILYRANPGGMDTITVPPSAVLYKGDLQTLALSVFTEYSGASEMSVEELAADGNYMFLEQYDLLCKFNAEGQMQSFTVRVGVPSE